MSYTLPEPSISLAWCSWTEKWEFRDIEYCLKRLADYRVIGYTAAQMQSAYEAGRASRDAEVEALKADAERLDWLSNNFYSRENLDWITGKVCNKNNMWVFFAPVGHQGNIRTVLDAARKEK